MQNVQPIVNAADVLIVSRCSLVYSLALFFLSLCLKEPEVKTFNICMTFLIRSIPSFPKIVGIFMEFCTFTTLPKAIHLVKMGAVYLLVVVYWRNLICNARSKIITFLHSIYASVWIIVYWHICWKCIQQKKKRNSFGVNTEIPYRMAMIQNLNGNNGHLQWTLIGAIL